MKTCTKCKINKDLGEFYPNGDRPGKQARCITCSVETTREWRRDNKERSAAQSNRNNKRGRYGLTVEEYSKILDSQNGLCAICENINSSGRSLSVDHSHTTGKIRALLCNNCNVALGLFKEDTGRMVKAIQYLNLYLEV